MSSEEVRKVSLQDIQQVQNLIEHCLQTYMNRREVVDALSIQAKVEPDFTELVWDKLEEENREFFKAYHGYLMVKQQIMIFNKLLERQVELTCTMCPLGVASLPISNGPHSSLHRDPLGVDPFFLDLDVTKSRHHQIRTSVSPFNDLSMHGNVQSADDNLVDAVMMNVSPHMHYYQNSEMAVLQQMNELFLIKTEPTYSDSGLMFDANVDVLEMPQTVGDAVGPFYGSLETTLQPFNGHLLATDTSLFRLGQIPNNFALSDLTAHHFQSSAIQEGYLRSPFLGTDVRDSYAGVNGRLDTTSEGLRRNLQ